MSTATDMGKGGDLLAECYYEGNRFASKFGIMQEARLIGGGMITLALIAVVLNEILTTSAINNSTGPFGSFIDQDLTTTGVAAMGLLVVGFLVVAANAILGRFGGGF